MLTVDNTIRLHKLHQRLIAATHREIKKDGHHKSSEAAMSVEMILPNAFEQSKGIIWRVWAYSYLLCPDGRQDEWSGGSPSEAIAKAEDAIGSWCEPSEFEEFSQFMDRGGDDSNIPEF